MNKNKTYEGHKNYTHWNVSLWLANEYSWYIMARDILKKYRNASIAARHIQSNLPERTPDGARFSLVAIKAYALDELKELRLYESQNPQFKEA